MRNCFAPAILQNSKLLAGAEGQLLKGFLHNHHKMPPCQHRQRDGHGWSTLGGQPSERWSWMVYAGGAAHREMVMDGLRCRGQPSERWSWMVYTGGAALREMVMDGLHCGGSPQRDGHGRSTLGGLGREQPFSALGKIVLEGE